MKKFTKIELVRIEDLRMDIKLLAKRLGIKYEEVITLVNIKK